MLYILALICMHNYAYTAIHNRASVCMSACILVCHDMHNNYVLGMHIAISIYSQRIILMAIPKALCHHSPLPTHIVEGGC